MEHAEVIFKLNSFAPLETSESWDNVGLLVESSNSRNVSKILLTNDLTKSVLDEAIALSVDIILSYHPPIFSPLKKITSQTWKENIVRLCLINGISIYSPHTCYDALNGGVNDWLIEAFGKGETEPISYCKQKNNWSHLIKLQLLQEARSGEDVLAEFKSKFNEDIRISHYNLDVDVLCKERELPSVLATLFQDNFNRYLEHRAIIKLEEFPKLNTGMGRFSKLNEEISIGNAVKMVKKHLGLSHVRLALKHGGTEDDKISTVAVCAGSGGSVLKLIKADLYLTGEMSHHEVLDYTQRGKSVILTDHSNCERGYLSTTLKPSLSKLLVVDVYSDWCGPCSSMTGHFRRIKMELGDDCLTLALASADRISVLEKFRGKAEPTFLFFGSGKPLCAIHGADGPILLNTIRERLMHERNVARGKAENIANTVLLDSLVKPEEVIEPDEDLDDVEGDRADDSDDENGKPMEAVLLISPTVIATDRTEPFLSQLVSAGFVICGHVQRELSNEELHSLFYPPTEEEEEEEENKEESNEDEKECEVNKEEEKSEEIDAQEKMKLECERKLMEKDLAFWEEELCKGPLYMLLLRNEEGDIFEAWDALLGPTELAKAKAEAPESLIGQFGDEDLAIPAWLPKCKVLQQQLKNRFFPPPLDADLPRLLLLPDPDDHQHVLETLCSGGLQVLAHTQATLTEEAFAKLHSSASEPILKENIGLQLLAIVIIGENAPSIASELRSPHLTSRAETSLDEIGFFFPELAADLMSEPSPHEEPQTQMQIEQKKENSEK